MPLWAIRNAFRPSISAPRKRTEPLACTCPITDLTRVERPTPLRPSRLTISPSPTRRSMPCNTWLLPYQACSPSMLRISVMARLAQISRLHGGVGADRRRGVASDHLAVDQHGNLVGQAEHHAHIVLHHQQGFTDRDFADQFHRCIRFRAAHA